MFTICRFGYTICKSYNKVSNFIVLIHNFENSFIMQNNKTSLSSLCDDRDVSHDGTGSRIRRVNQPSAQ